MAVLMGWEQTTTGLLLGFFSASGSDDGAELPFEHRDGETDPNIRLFVATLVHPTALREARGTILWDRSEIARLLLKHADNLPWARSMQIGT